jgi:ubiquinone/menaquinone biosynthesis C-methylase UbiE
VEPTDHNLRAWDEVHRRRAEAMAGETGIPDWVRERLPEVAGKHVLHLQCGTGDSTAELAELGALATGLDISGEALEVARERVPTAAFIQGDVQALPTELRRGRFDLVYTGGGVLSWVLDLEPWGHGVATALKPGGQLLLYDTHPVVKCLDAALHWRESYFRTEVEPDTGWETTDEQRERLWQLGQIVTAIADAGLVVTRLDEVPSDRRRQRQDPRVPGEFLLLALKPSAPAAR